MGASLAAVAWLRQTIPPEFDTPIVLAPLFELAAAGAFIELQQHGPLVVVYVRSALMVPDLTKAPSFEPDPHSTFVELR
jgi:hypothetical protein